uniref:Ring finger protein, transmembrane 2 n=1 Tax=Ficedula albicollis TaxID=59894 RepID=A0A803VBI3_FICAL
MASTFAYANSTLREQVALKEKRSVLVVFWILAFLTGNTLYLLYTFSSQQLYNSLIFLKPNLDRLDFFNLMWIVGIADFVLKFLTIALKCLVLALPKVILAVKSKGKFYLVIEELSQLFRSLVPIQVWYKYIVGDDPSGSYFLGGILVIMYSLCKSFDICGRVGSVRKALKVLCTPQVRSEVSRSSLRGGALFLLNDKIETCSVHSTEWSTVIPCWTSWGLLSGMSGTFSGICPAPAVGRDCSSAV